MHEELLDVVREVIAARKGPSLQPEAKRLLSRVFLLIAKLAHKHPTNQGVLWEFRDAITEAVQLHVGAEVSVTEVRRGVAFWLCRCIFKYDDT